MKFNGISVILPSFCRLFTEDWECGFVKAAESVLDQECDLPLELIIIDDGSVTPIIQRRRFTELFRDNRVRYIRLHRNNGLVFALNTGLNHANYDLIARIDCDDLWYSEKLDKQIRFFVDDPDLTIVGTGMRLVYAGDQKTEEHIRPGTWAGILQFIAEVGCPFPHGSILAKKSIYRLLGGYSHDPSFMHCEDFFLWAVWLRFFKGAMVEEVLYDYTISQNAVSVSHASQQRKASGVVHQCFLKLNNYKKIPTAIKRISDILNLPLIKTGEIFYLVWKYYELIIASRNLLELLREILPDRRIIDRSEVKNQLHDRSFYFSVDEDCCGSHLRCADNINSLMDNHHL